VYVVPGATRPGPDGRHGGVPRLRVASPPAEGRANAEAERLLADVLRASVRLSSGARSRRKRFDTDLAAGVLERRLTEIFGERQM
jgi:uncharacterized protein YggU (UPF0235/DUF167 family)